MKEPLIKLRQFDSSKWLDSTHRLLTKSLRDPANATNSQLEAAYHKADKAIENIVNLLKAA